MTDQTDNSFNANNNTGTQTWMSFSVSEDAKRYFLMFLLAVNVVIIIINLWMFDVLKAEMRLKEYDLDYFRSHDFADLKAKVEAEREANRIIISTLANRSK